MEYDMDAMSVRKQAEKELRDEAFRHAVDKLKERIRRRRWWHYLLPYKVVLVRRDHE